MDNSKGKLRYIIPLFIVVAVAMFAAGFLYSKKHYAVNETSMKKSENLTEAVSAVRYGKVVKVRPEKLEYYKMLHANPWPEVINALRECNLRNFSIYYKEGYLFSYYEYTGKDYDADMNKLGGLTRKWLNETDPCQEPVATAKPGELWSVMEEVFHMN